MGKDDRPAVVGARIRKYREDAGLTQDQVSALADITQPTLSSIERGETKEPEARTILRIAAALQTSPYILMFDHRPPGVDPTMSTLIDAWAQLDQPRRMKLLAYAQGLVDAGPPKPHPPQRPRPSDPQSH